MDLLKIFLHSTGVPASISTAVVLLIVIVDRVLKFRKEANENSVKGDNREREILSQDQQAFRTSILEQLSIMQKQVTDLTEELDKTREEKFELQKKYIHLESLHLTYSSNEHEIELDIAEKHP